MDVKKYYCQSRFGDYAIHFSNTSEVPSDEVEQLFSKFGEINRVSQTGGSTGLCFINFVDEQSAINAIQGLGNHDRIKLREASLLNSSKKERPDRNADSDKSRNFSKPFNTEKSDKPFIDRHRNRNDSFSSTKNFNHKKDASFSRNPRSSKMTDDKPFKSDAAAKKPDDFDVDKSVAFSKVPDNKITEIKVPEAKTTIEEIKSQIKLPALIKASNSPSINTVPDLIVNKSNLTLKVQAEEVIVSNIPDDFGIHWILNLFEKFQPLCASFIKSTRVSKTYSLRYCHVYFPSYKLADAVEKKFDNFKLNDKHLIVMRAQNLAAQVK